MALLKATVDPEARRQRLPFVFEGGLVRSEADGRRAKVTEITRRGGGRRGGRRAARRRRRGHLIRAERSRVQGSLRSLKR